MGIRVYLVENSLLTLLARYNFPTWQYTKRRKKISLANFKIPAKKNGNSRWEKMMYVGSYTADGKQK